VQSRGHGSAWCLQICTVRCSAYMPNAILTLSSGVIRHRRAWQRWYRESKMKHPDQKAGMPRRNARIQHSKGNGTHHLRPCHTQGRMDEHWLSEQRKAGTSYQGGHHAASSRSRNSSKGRRAPINGGRHAASNSSSTTESTKNSCTVLPSRFGPVRISIGNVIVTALHVMIDKRSHQKGSVAATAEATTAAATAESGAVAGASGAGPRKRSAYGARPSLFASAVPPPSSDLLSDSFL